MLLSTLAPDLASNATPPTTNPPATEVSQPNVVSSPQGSSSSIVNDPVLPEAVPNSADGFNWQEENVTVDVLTDGMAALSVEPTGVGYLGKLQSLTSCCMTDQRQAQRLVWYFYDVYSTGLAFCTKPDLKPRHEIRNLRLILEDFSRHHKYLMPP